LVLQAWREGQSNQGLLPLVGQGPMIAIPPSKDDAAELGDHTQGVLQNLGRYVVAIHQNSYTRFSSRRENSHPCSYRLIPVAWEGFVQTRPTSQRCAGRHRQVNAAASSGLAASSDQSMHLP